MLNPMFRRRTTRDAAPKRQIHKQSSGNTWLGHQSTLTPDLASLARAHIGTKLLEGWNSAKNGNLLFYQSSETLGGHTEVLEGRGAFMRSDRFGHSSPSSSSSSSSTRDGLSRTNDDSSVVSLKALVAKADAKVAVSRPATTEDSGLIDLKSLLASAPQPKSDALPPVLQPPAAGLFDVPPMPIQPHVGASAGSAGETPAPRSSRAAKMFVAASALALVVVGAVGVVQMQANQARTEEAASAAAIPEAPVEAARPVEAASAAEVQAPEVANPAGESAPPTEATQPRVNRQATVNSVPHENTRREQPVATAKPKSPEAAPPAGPCDLMCEIQRAAKKKKTP